MKGKILFGVMLLLLVLLVVSGCAHGISQTEYDTVIAERDAAQAELAKIQEKSSIPPPYSKNSEGDPVCLVNNEFAENPSWRELKDFLVDDKTDLKTYSYKLYSCGAFAEDLHNSAEAAGIRAAWVAISFVDRSDGHALNAFETTDKGLVYVDCTSTGQSLPPEPSFVDAPFFSEPESWDKIAYVSGCKELGFISLEVVDRSGAAEPLGYSFYEAHQTNCEMYNRAVEIIDQEGWDPANLALLSAIRAKIGDFIWESQGVVCNVEIYW